MSVVHNKALLQQYIEEVWDKENPAAVDQFFCPSVPASPVDGIITVVEMIAEGDKVAFRSTMRGTHQC
jgi:hypothetical protein